MGVGSGGKRTGAGRKRKLAVVQKIEGNVGHRPDHVEPGFPPLVSIPPPPEWLGKYGRECWVDLMDQLHRAGVVKRTDLETFGALCNAWDIFRTARDAVTKAGTNTVINHNGVEVRSADYTIMMESTAAWMRYMALFGFAPTERSRVQFDMLGGDDEGDFA